MNIDKVTLITVIILPSFVIGFWVDQGLANYFNLEDELVQYIDCQTDITDLPQEYRDDVFERCNPQIKDFLNERGLKLTYDS